MVYAACESLDVTPVHSRALAKSVYVCDYLVEFLRGNLQELFLYGESDTQPDYIPGWGDRLAHGQGKSKIGKEVHSVVEIGDVGELLAVLVRFLRRRGGSVCGLARAEGLPRRFAAVLLAGVSSSAILDLVFGGMLKA